VSRSFKQLPKDGALSRQRSRVRVSSSPPYFQTLIADPEKNPGPFGSNKPSKHSARRAFLGLRRSLALPQVCWTDGGRRETHACRNATSFATSSHRCLMKRLYKSRTLCVLRHGPSLFVLSPNRIFLPDSLAACLATFSRRSPLPDPPCGLRCSAAQFRRTSAPTPPSIQFA
jgi:hypothetical protein